MAAAREVFAQRGWAATMADIAATAGVSQGLAYRYFAGKAEIVQALLEQAVRAATPPPSAQDASGTPLERLERLLRNVLEARRERVGFFRILQHALQDPGAPAGFRELVRGRALSFRQALGDLIREGQASGEVAAGDPEELVLAILAMLSGLSTMAAGDPQRLREHFPSTGVVLRLLRPGPDAGRHP